MSKYNFSANHEDWEKLYKVIREKFGVEMENKFKKMQSMDSAVTAYACLTHDYKLTALK